MLGLLQVDFGSVLAFSLVGFSEDGVEGFLEYVSGEDVGNLAGHHQLKSLQGVLSLSGGVYEEWVHSTDRGHGFEHRLGTHALNWETNRSEVELPTKNLFAYRLEDFFSGTSHSACDF